MDEEGKSPDSETKITICISGLAGTGKSTLAKKIAQEYHLTYYSGGDELQALALAKGYKPTGRGWWESPEGLSFLEVREKDPNFDRAVDQKLLEHANQGNILFDSWTMPWLLSKSFNIWLEASLEKRATRVAKRDKTSVKDAITSLKEKEARTKDIYKDLYGFALGEDFTPFHVILSTEDLSAKEVFQVLCKIIGRLTPHTDS